MSRSFLLLSLLKEAHDLDTNFSRRQALRRRNISLFTGKDEFISLHRLSEELFMQLEEEISPLLRPHKRKGHTKRSKILCALTFLASGSYQKAVGRNITTYLSQPSVSRCIKEIVEVLNHPGIVKKYIRFPQNHLERRLLQERFYEKFSIPGVIGCVDGTFVAILRPQENEERYYCRKGYHARNVMLVVDADLNILHVDASYGGATHDAFIFNNSVIKHNLEGLNNSGEVVYLLGDSGYPQRSYLMTPINGATDNTREAHYNKIHATAHNTVERAIGVLKARFRCLLVHRVLHYNPDMAAKIVVACCVLHNICNRAGLTAPMLNDSELQQESLLGHEQSLIRESQQDIAVGCDSRNNLVNILWQSR